jgi:hypothetical protein
MRLIACAVIVLGACGSAKPRPAGPDPAELAAALYADLVELRTIAERHQGDCPTLVAALQPLVSRMRAHKQDVDRSLAEPAVAEQLRAEVRTYDDRARGLPDAIGASLGASYTACKDDALIGVIDLIPTL